MAHSFEIGLEIISSQYMTNDVNYSWNKKIANVSFYVRHYLFLPVSSLLSDLIFKKMFSVT